MVYKSLVTRMSLESFSTNSELFICLSSCTPLPHLSLSAPGKTKTKIHSLENQQTELEWSFWTTEKKKKTLYILEELLLGQFCLKQIFTYQKVWLGSSGIVKCSLDNPYSIPSLSYKPSFFNLFYQNSGA